MSYQRALVTRWSGRDRLAVLVIAVTAAFLVGAIVVLLAISGQTTAMATEHGADATVQVTDSPEPATADEATTFPLAEVTVDGEQRTVVGVPDGGTHGIESPEGVAGQAAGTRVTLVGEEATVQRPRVDRTGDSPFPDSWLVTDAATARSLGADRGLAFEDASATVPEEGAPLTGALAFFVLGTRQLLGLLGVVCLGVALLVGVVVFSVMRMTVRDRRSTLAVLRATGASSRRIGLLVTARAALLTVAGVALGYAVGVVVPNAAATAAVTLGFPVGLPLAVGGRTGALAGAVLLGVVVVGAAAGALAARSAIRGAPFDDPPESSDRWPGGPSFLPASAAIPTTATLTVFVTFVLVVAALGGVVGSIGATGDGAGGTIVAEDAVHPVDSQVPVAYADRLDAAGVAASPEILLFLVHDGQAVPARGVAFDDYRSITDARVVAGRAPNATDEVIVGTDFARTHGVEPGDELALGGSTVSAVCVVEAVGTFESDGAADDHMLLGLQLARHLEDVPAGSANVVRYGGRPAVQSNQSVVAFGLNAPRRVAQNETVPVRVRLRNVGADAATRTIEATFGERTRTRRATLDAGSQRTVEFSFDAGEAGDRVVRVGDATWTVRVRSPESLVLAPLPERGPPNASLLVDVGTVAGSAVEGATVSIGDRLARTNADGEAWIRLPSSSNRTDTDGTDRISELRVAAGERVATRQIRVAPGATREPAVRLATPDRIGTFGTPRTRLRIRNPWTTASEHTIALGGPGVERSESVALQPGEGTTIAATLARRPPGEYSVQATVGSTETTGQYRVAGDERLASAIASSGQVGGAGPGGLVSRAFGNVWLVLGTLVALGTLMTVGSTVAAFADAVQARRGDIGIHRAVGAGPGRLARLVLADALRIGVPAAVASVVLAGVALQALSRLELLTVFGVRVAPSVSLWLVVPLALGGLLLALASAGVVTWRYGSVDPSRLIGGGR